MKNIIERVKDLNFPPDQYVVVGSGLLDALGIRHAADIDIAVLPELFGRLCQDTSWEKYIKFEKTFLKKSDADIIPSLAWPEYPTTTEEAIKSAMIIEGIPFLNPQELKKFKQALGRDKDIEDIKLIDAYLLTANTEKGSNLVP